MLLERPQDSSAPNVKHLDRPIITPRYDQLSIFSKLGTSSCTLEPGDRLDHLPRLRRIDQHACR